MPRSFLPCFLLLLLLPSAPLGAATDRWKVSDRLEWPPLFEREFGCPVVVATTGEEAGTEVKLLRPLSRLLVTTPVSRRKAADETVCDFFLERVWNAYLAPETLTKRARAMRADEMFPMTRERFFRIGRSRLLGLKQTSTLDDAWWKVRMDLPLSWSEDRFLALNSVRWAERRVDTGHFSLAIRRRGGSADDDYILDFRAPWFLARRPGRKDVVAHDLDLNIYRDNYYDWLYTQCAHRHCHVSIHFARVSEEHLVLLDSKRSHLFHAGGGYELFKQNCASLGAQFINQLLPLDQSIRTPGFADFPGKVISQTLRHFGGEQAQVEMRSVTVEAGREINNRNLARPALPSRSRSLPFLLLRDLPGIN